jgi:iron complex outermembrane receptor protein
MRRNLVHRALVSCVPVALAAGTLFFCGGVPVVAQETGSVLVRVVAVGRPITGAAVRAGAVVSESDTLGTARLNLPPGAHRIIVERIGYESATVNVVLRAGADTTIVVELVARALRGIEEDAIIVTSTRGDRRVEDEPLRVEVLVREEIEEKLLMTPGDIAMLLNETSGLRVQETSPSLGGANIRIQGLRGRYTQLLADGLPLYGGQTGALGLLQIPPMDLGQVEVIKGAASALYGASALGGVVNLISRRPPAEHEVLINATTRRGGDALIWLADTLAGSWGYTLIAGAHGQESADVDGDGWRDIPRYRRVTARPRLFRDAGAGNAVMVTAGVMVEDRDGGGQLPTGAWFERGLRTTRFDAGATGRSLLRDDLLLDIRLAASRTRHDHEYASTVESDRHSMLFAEASLRGSVRSHAWVAGVAAALESFTADSVMHFNYTHAVPSLFVQDEFAVAPWLRLAASARLDSHNRYGTFWSPRASALVRADGPWSFRVSAGGGYFAPTPFTDETEEVGLGRVVPSGDLIAERAWSGSADLGAVLGGLELNATLFGSVIDRAVGVRAEPIAGRAELFNRDGKTRTTGAELLARVRRPPFVATASYTYLRATEPTADSIDRADVPLTPRHAAGLVAMIEDHDVGRAGVEVYYTGRQTLDDDPFRTSSEPYVIIGFLFERRSGRYRVFLNLENITDVRQTRFSPFVRPTAGAYGRWTTDEWAPLEGRVFNGGIRVLF